MPAGRKYGKPNSAVTSATTRPTLWTKPNEARHMEVQTDPPPDGGIQAGSAAFDALMLAITTCQAALTTKIDHV